MEQIKQPFVGYEYLDVTVKRNMAHLYADSYENFGWELEGTGEQIGKVDSIVMKFRRDRKILNKVELTRLQRNFDACVSEITALETQKYIKASAVAYAIGLHDILSVGIIPPCEPDCKILRHVFLYDSQRRIPAGVLRHFPVSYTHLDVYKRQVYCRKHLI